MRKLTWLSALPAAALLMLGAEPARAPHGVEGDGARVRPLLGPAYEGGGRRHVVGPGRVAPAAAEALESRAHGGARDVARAQLALLDHLELVELVEEVADRGHELEVFGEWTLGFVSAASREQDLVKAGASPRFMLGYAMGR